MTREQKGPFIIKTLGHRHFEVWTTSIYGFAGKFLARFPTAREAQQYCRGELP